MVDLRYYPDQLQRAARTLANLPRKDGGWGLTPTSVSSIVNTTEVAVVLRAAGMTGTITDRAMDYLIAAIPAYCQPEPSGPALGFGRGERTRFVSFGLEGLTTYPEYTFVHGLETVRWCLDWLNETVVTGGWPETRGQLSVSIHQTSRVVCSLVRLILADQKTPALDDRYRAIARKLARGGAQRLLALESSEDGSWPIRPALHAPASATKTALAATALGYYEHLEQDREIEHARRDAARWLMRNQDVWVNATEEDTDEQGTHWVHLAYAECVRGVLAGFSIEPVQLSKSWSRLAQQWSEEDQLWTEPGKPEGKATIRAAYHTVMAFESARPESALVIPTPLWTPEESVLGKIIDIVAHGVAPGVIVVRGTNSHADADIGEGPRRTFDAIQALGNADIGALEAETGKSPSAIYKDIERINRAVSTASLGELGKIIVSTRRGKTYQYHLDLGVASG